MCLECEQPLLYGPITPLQAADDVIQLPLQCPSVRAERVHLGLSWHLVLLVPSSIGSRPWWEVLQPLLLLLLIAIVLDGETPERDGEPPQQRRRPPAGRETEAGRLHVLL